MIELKNINKTYKMGDINVPALKNASFKINDGEFVAIMGPSGSGKSTLLNILGCLDVPTKGDYLIDDINVSEFSDSQLARIRNEKIGFVFQSYNLLPRMTAVSNVELPLIYSGNHANRKEMAINALRAVNLEDRANHRPRELSGGEQQRVAIARALTNEPSILLADEPTGNLDSKSGKEIMSTLTELNKKGITIVMVTHDNSVAAHAQRIIRLKDGEIVEDQRVSGQAETDETSIPARNEKKKRKFSIIELKESVTMAVSSIFSNKLRSFLTMLGIIVGVGAVITMIAIGQGASAQITQRIRQMGANLIMVQQFRRMMGGGSITPLSYGDAKAIAEQCPSVARVDATYHSHSQAVYGNMNTDTEVNGVTPNFPGIRNFPVERGSFFTEDDNKLMRRVAVLGKSVVKNLFGEEEP
ncbi:MAG: ATP-binding cassette domain-containing protein, partial [candidate division WOR-3 bacterium]|nr:ATP-binding cassette domain-containing protein [candidate division WOR-3 bacterium]